MDAIFFPELSITGYEPKSAEALARQLSDIEFDCFEEISHRENITIGIGVPEKAKDGIKISMFIFQPDQTRGAYSKQHLHSDEYSYFVSGQEQFTISLNGEKIVPAICYESLIRSYFESALVLGAEIYVASVA